MGRRGPPPKPTYLRSIDGGAGRRPSSSSSSARSKPATTRPPAPGYLSRDERLEYRRLVRELERLGLVDRIDRDALVTYVQLWTEIQDARDALRKFGRYTEIRNDAGAVCGYALRPEVGTIRNALPHLRALFREFGLTPSARSSFELQGGKSPLEELEDELDS